MFSPPTSTFSHVLYIYVSFFRVFHQGNEVYGGGDKSVGIFLHRSSDNAVVKGGEQVQGVTLPAPFLHDVHVRPQSVWQAAG